MKITNSMLFDANLTQLECYYKIIEELKSAIPDESSYVIKIEFDNSDEIKFIHPIFLVYILNFYELLQTEEKYQYQDVRIILNIEELTPSVQKYIHTYLTQYIDCNIILLVDSTFGDRHKTPSLFTDKKILLYTTEKENNLTLLMKLLKIKIIGLKTRIQIKLKKFLVLIEKYFISLYNLKLLNKVHIKIRVTMFGLIYLRHIYNLPIMVHISQISLKKFSEK